MRAFRDCCKIILLYRKKCVQKSLHLSKGGALVCAPPVHSVGQSAIHQAWPRNTIPGQIISLYSRLRFSSSSSTQKIASDPPNKKRQRKCCRGMLLPLEQGLR